MRAEELEKLVRFKDNLNPDIWQNNNLRREVEYKLLLIAKEFINFINIPDLKLKDITLSGSNASYNYNDHSDLDLHLIVDMDTPCGAQLKELFQAKKSQFNDQYDILIRGHEVEVYVQDSKQPHISNGIYSVLKDEWLKQPKKISANPDETNIKHKYEFLKAEIDRAVESMDPRAIARLQLKIKEMRRAGLEKSGEYGVENLAFKLLRNDGSLDALYSAKQKADDMRLSLPEAEITEAVSGKDMLKIFRKMHWDKKGRNPEMDQYILSNNWGIRMIQPSEIPGEEELFDIDDPFDRIIEIDPDAVRAHARDIKAGSTAPIIMGPGNSIIDGNHRAQAAKALNKPIQAYVPMGKVSENFADGKNPGRKGLAKRMGVPTGASVTRLRQIAKNSSGEKARMAHWMANMKSGKKKS